MQVKKSGEVVEGFLANDLLSFKKSWENKRKKGGEREIDSGNWELQEDAITKKIIPFLKSIERRMIFFYFKSKLLPF